MSITEDVSALVRAATVDPLDVVRRALEAAQARFTTASTAVCEAEAEQFVASQELRRLEAAYRALTGETPLPEATSVVAEKIAEPTAPPPPPAKPLGGICMACEKPAVFPTYRTMRGVQITVNTCQECGCDNLL